MQAATDTAWDAVATSFAALGRVALLLDADTRVIRASKELDSLVCKGTSVRIIGRPASALFGSLFEPESSLVKTLESGSREEGRRAFIKCPETGAQLVSVSVAPLPADIERLHPAARYLVVMRPADAVPELAGAVTYHGLMAKSPAMLQVVALIEALGASEANVLITGETGTGKGVVAQAIHAHSPRRAGPFVALNMAAIPSNFLESELFGHVRGAFTGATHDRRGQFELARGGTLFLDEIGDMPLALQVKLLRVVQERKFRRLGEESARPMDSRIIAATNVDLAAAVSAGRFREDLYYRLRVVPMHIPPLRERRLEIDALARYLLARVCARAGRELILSPDAVEALENYPWPGNVRQLENALEYAVAICRGQTLQVEHLPIEVRPGYESPADDGEGSAVCPVPDPDVETTIDAGVEPAPSEAERIRAALELHRWKRAAVAKALGMSRTTLWRRMRELGIS